MQVILQDCMKKHSSSSMLPQLPLPTGNYVKLFQLILLSLKEMRMSPQNMLFDIKVILN